MFVKNLYLVIALLISSISSLFAVNPTNTNIAKVEVKILLQIGNRTGEFVTTINSETYTLVSMDKENLGYALKLVDVEEGKDWFDTMPTRNGKAIANGFTVGKSMSFGAGCNLNGQVIEKDLIIKILSVKKIS